MQLTSWGRYPILDADVDLPANFEAAGQAVRQHAPLIPYGVGRSYGDSALAARVLDTRRLGLFLSFDPATGLLRAQAGVTLDEVLTVFVPKGWFLRITPGTKYVTLGGAIASDVHGKSHHVDGCFSESVLDFKLLLADGSIVTCSRSENAELFRATCGGMGLTGVVLEVGFYLQPIKSASFEQTTYKCANLEEVLQRLDETRAVRYAVSWIDCVSQGDSLGRSVLTVGDHATEGPLKAHGQPLLNVPIVAPDWVVSPLTIKAFNTLFYHKTLAKQAKARVHYLPFFYPLDVAANWNRLYGKAGFTQYQFVIPKAAGPKGMREILLRIADSQLGSALAVVKTTGPANDNPLSFPLEGYTLALDFKIQAALFPLLDELDAMVQAYGGRIYLTKDVRLNEKNFKQSYPRWAEFQAVREKVGAIGRFASLQSKRLGLD